MCACKDCKYYDESTPSIFGGWCLAGVHLHEKKITTSGVDPDDHCFDWESKDGSDKEEIQSLSAGEG